MNLPKDIAGACAPLFEILPPDKAMDQLVVTTGAKDDVVAMVNQVLQTPHVGGNPYLAAGLWLYVDELDRSHEFSQGLKDSTGAFWHGIMHRREGDFGNSHYWFNNTGHHPAMELIPGYDGHAFIDEVAARHKEQPQDLITMQRQEWAALFEWCAKET